MTIVPAPSKPKCSFCFIVLDVESFSMCQIYRTMNTCFQCVVIRSWGPFSSIVIVSVSHWIHCILYLCLSRSGSDLHPGEQLQTWVWIQARRSQDRYPHHWREVTGWCDASCTEPEGSWDRTVCHWYAPPTLRLMIQINDINRRYLLMPSTWERWCLKNVFTKILLDLMLKKPKTSHLMDGIVVY